MLLLVLPHSGFLPHSPPTPLAPAGREGSLTATFDWFAPTTLLRAERCRCVGALRLRTSGRRGHALARLATGARGTGWPQSASLAATTTQPFTTTATPETPETPARNSAPQPHSGSTVFGAKQPNVAIELPSRPAGARGVGGEWGEQTKQTETKSWT